MTDDSDLATYATAQTIGINALIWAGKWRTAVQKFNELAEQLAGMGETLPGGLLDGTLPGGHAQSTRMPEPERPKLSPPGSIDAGDVSGDAAQNAAAMAACRQGAHAWAAADSNGWRTCAHCGNVNVTPG